MSSGERAIERLELLYRIGGGEGANRPGLSPAEDEAHRAVQSWMEAAGLATSVDAAGNLYGRLIGTAPDLPEIWCGSHLDSVPNGGRYDGALGVVAGLEAVTNLRPQRRTVTVVAFRDEEGSRFGGGFLGSRAVTGAISEASLDRTDRHGVSVREALAGAGRSLAPSAGWLVAAPAAYLEAHIEQGPVLAGRDAALGVVTSIVGMLELEVVFEGREGHAGTTPMDLRRDAALCAAAFQVEAAGAARALPAATVTVGTSVALEPGATNVVARRATVVVDARAPTAPALAALERALQEAAERCALEHGCRAAVARTMAVEPVPCDPLVRGALERALPGAPALASGAGHDAQILAAAGVPVGMLFVRSRNDGISHSPDESTDDDDVRACVDALCAALCDLAGLPG